MTLIGWGLAIIDSRIPGGYHIHTQQNNRTRKHCITKHNKTQHQLRAKGAWGLKFKHLLEQGTVPSSEPQHVTVGGRAVP